jgi:hypothetical protein
MTASQSNGQPGGGTAPRRDRTVLVAIIGAAGVIVAAGLGGYIGHITSSVASPTTTQASLSSGHPGHATVLKLNFVPESSGTVPWCNTFYIKASAQLPAGYEILIFDASADPQFQVTSDYGYDYEATPAKGNPDEWKTGDVYAGSKYKQDANGNYISKNGKHVSNAGYTVVVYAVLVPDNTGQLLATVRPKSVQLTQLPPGVMAKAQFDATRNSDVKPCPA